MRRFLILLLILQVAISCYAQDSGFFKADAARDIFAPRPDLLNHEKLEDFPRQNKPGFMEPEPTPIQANFNQTQAQDIKADQQADTQGLSTAELIKRKHGDPASHVAVKPIDSAPAPMKGMYAALEAGESELAFEYAKQWVRYFEDLKRTNARFVTMTSFARKRVKEDLAKSGSNQDSQLDEDKILYEQDKLAAEKKLSDEDVEQAARRIIQESESQNSSQASNSQAERIRLALKDRVPVDNSGQVNLMFFFNTEDETVLPYFKDMEQLYQSLKAEGKVNVVGFSINKVDDAKLADMATKLGTTFPLLNGNKAAGQFNVRKSPTYIFVSAASGQSFVETTARRFNYLSEVVKMMQGKTKSAQVGDSQYEKN